MISYENRQKPPWQWHLVWGLTVTQSTMAPELSPAFIITDIRYDNPKPWKGKKKHCHTHTNLNTAPKTPQE